MGRHVISQRSRMIEREMQACLADHPIVLVTGPRASGKTTTASLFAAQTVRLNVAADATMFRIDPTVALASFSGRPLLIDEWQEVPEIMHALKGAADDHAPAGSFVLTGSVQPSSDIAWPATGRIIELSMAPLTVRETAGGGGGDGLIDALSSGRDVALDPNSAPDLADYIDIAFAGGFPEPAINLDARGQRRWYETYADQMCGRDVLSILRRADSDLVRRYFEAYALNSAGVTDEKTIFDAAGINKKTAAGYAAVLKRLFVISTVPAWSSNRLKRLTRTPKRFVVDPALMTAAARLQRDDVMRDGLVLGRLIETLVYAQLAPELAARHPAYRLYHLRTDNAGRREVDLLVDLGGGRVLAFEIKASVSPDQHDARHLAWLRDSIGDDFVRGVVLHTGRNAYPLGDRIEALPICAFWQA